MSVVYNEFFTCGRALVLRKLPHPLFFSPPLLLFFFPLPINTDYRDKKHFDDSIHNLCRSLLDYKT